MQLIYRHVQINAFEDNLLDLDNVSNESEVRDGTIVLQFVLVECGFFSNGVTTAVFSVLGNTPVFNDIYYADESG